ncbi:MAG: magnesium and cobalt transport protein CorA [Bifidobacteriaceae bacterium]|jgi:magnesium transporter|nr:magnesium and cobalt transport protein CorA [Bifidobacteriaceae bacterium]
MTSSQPPLPPLAGPEPPASAVPPESLTKATIYKAGQFVREVATLDEARAAIEADPEALAWVGLYRPTAEEVIAAAIVFGFHELIVEDVLRAHQRSKLERYGDTQFVVLHPAVYQDASSDVAFGEIYVVAGPNFVVTIRHCEHPAPGEVRARLEAEPKLLALGSEAVLYGYLDTVVDLYPSVVHGLQEDIDELEAAVFDGDPDATRRIYRLTREVTEYARAVRSTDNIMDALQRGFEEHDVDRELRRYLRDVSDHLTRVLERAEILHSALRDIVNLNSTLVAQRENEQMKKISGWAAVFFVPTVITGIYGMNFDRMPELHWLLGYPFAGALMVAGAVAIYLFFKHKDWI